jgi:hypothetical protein
MSHGRSTTDVFSTAADVPPVPSSDRLAISGATILLYVAHRVDAAKLERAVDDGRVAPLVGERSYMDKVRSGSGLIQSRLIAHGRIPTPLDAFLEDPDDGEITSSLLWLGGDYAMSAVPLVLARGGTTVDTAFQLKQPLTVDECLSLIGQLLGDAFIGRLTDQLTATLDELDLRDGGVQSWPLTDSLGLQIWDLTGTAGRDPSARYEGLLETQAYAWELSALLAYSSDHVLSDGLWRDRTADQVFQELAAGFSFFGDHMVFVNGTCCLEITHLPAWLRDRSEFRLRNHGYDSSSLFVWTVAVLRSAVADDLASRYRDSMAQLVELEGMTYQEQTDYAREQFVHGVLVDRLTRFRDSLKEQRNRAFDEHVSALRGDERTLAVLARDMDKANVLATNLATLRDQALQGRANTLIGMLAAVLAVASLPGLVNQFNEWVRAGEWYLLIGSSVGMLVILALLPLVLRPLVRRVLG